MKNIIGQHKQGHLHAAIAAYQRFAARHPDNPKALHYLGLAKFQTGSREQGLEYLRRAIALAPEDAPAWSDLGRMHAVLGQTSEAIHCLRQCVAVDRSYSDGWHNLGTILRQSGNTHAALTAYKQALALNPKRTDTWLNIGNLLVDDNQADNAIESFARAALLDPKLGQARASLAGELSGRGDVSEAEFIYRQAIALDPKHAQAWFGLGRTLEDLGQAEQAARCYRQVLALKPGQPWALGQLLGLAGTEADDDLVRDTHRVLDAQTISDGASALIGYGLGKLHDRRGEFNAAFTAYAHANRARRAQAGSFDRQEYEWRIERLIATFTETFFVERRRYGIGVDLPVFIVGMPRSGTTLTEQILDSHPKMFGAGELPCLAELAAGLQSRYRLDTSWPLCAPDLTAMNIHETAHAYLEKLRAKTPQAVLRASDKSPLNFFDLGLIALLFPQARIVHCRRNPIDTCLSIYFENFRRSQTWATELEDIAVYYRGYERLMTHWREVLSLQMLEVRYEDTVTDIEAQARRLVAFMDLPWDDRCLDFHRSRRAVQTPSRWQVRKPIYTSSVERWRRYQQHVAVLTGAFPEWSVRRANELR